MKRRIMYLMLCVLGLNTASNAQNGHLPHQSVFDFTGSYSSLMNYDRFYLVPAADGPCGTELAGAAWSTTHLDFTHDFIIDYELKVEPMSNHTEPSGADGHVVVFGKNITNATLNAGGGCIGYYTPIYNNVPADLLNSIGVEFDVFPINNQHANYYYDDAPIYGIDHIAVARETIPNDVLPDINNSLLPVSIDPVLNTVELYTYKKYRLRWDCGSKVLKVYYKGNLRLEVPIQPTNEFVDPTDVVWGITSGRKDDCSQFAFRRVVLQYSDACCYDGHIDVLIGDCGYNADGSPLPFDVGFTGLVDNLPSNVTITQFTWDYGDGTPVFVETNPLQNGMSNIHSYTQPGVYKVKLTIEGGTTIPKPSNCSFTVTAIINVPDCEGQEEGDGDDDDGTNHDDDDGAAGKPGQSNGIDSKNTGSEVLKLYPNPTKRELNVALPPSLETKVTKIEIELVDFMGRKVLESNNIQLNSNAVKFQLPQLSTGIYTVRIKIGEYVYIEKLAIE